MPFDNLVFPEDDPVDKFAVALNFPEYGRNPTTMSVEEIDTQMQQIDSRIRKSFGVIDVMAPIHRRRMQQLQEEKARRATQK
jgi:hypothetical protein